MKHILITILALCMLLSFAACGSDKTGDDTAAPESSAPSDYNENGELIIIDSENPLIEAESNSYRDIYSDDGKAHDNFYRIPKLNVNLEGANAVSDEIYSDFKNEYGTHFSMLDDLSGENVRTGEPYVTVDYSFEYHLDVLIVNIHGVSTAIDGTVTNTYNIYYYDALTDTELTLDDYLAYCATSYNDVAAAALESLEESHPEETEIDAHSLMYAIKTEDGDMIKLDAYMLLSNKDTVIVPVEVEKTTLDFSSIEVQ